jgi:3alpha(or 20beta)-hydroxysteroid dehydrogenase
MSGSSAVSVGPGRLEGKRALVTGAARGIGEAIARRYVAEGARVLLVDVLDDLGAAVADSLGDAATYRRLDVGSADDWAAVVAEVPAVLGGLDVLVNNAAILKVGPLMDIPPADYVELVRVNQLGVLLGMQAVVPLLRAAGGGSIVNLASVDGTRGMAGAGAYGSTKWAVRGLTKTAALELGRDRIRVNTINPGGCETPMTAPANLEGMAIQARDRVVATWALGRMSQPDELGGLATFLAADESAYCTGADFTIDGGQTAGTLLNRG